MLTIYCTHAMYKVILEPTNMYVYCQIWTQYNHLTFCGYWCHFLLWNGKATFGTLEVFSLKHAVKWLALPWSLVHQQLWQWMFPGKTTQRMQIPNIHSLCFISDSLSLVVSNIEQIIVFCFCSLNWLTVLKSIHTVFLFHSLTSYIF